MKSAKRPTLLIRYAQSRLYKRQDKDSQRLLFGKKNPLPEGKYNNIPGSQNVVMLDSAFSVFCVIFKFNFRQLRKIEGVNFEVC